MGSRRLQALIAGDLDCEPEVLLRLAGVLQLATEVMSEAVTAAQARKDRVHREAFVPHAIIVTERSVPSQITFCALIRGEMPFTAP